MAVQTPALVRGEVHHMRKTPFVHGLKFGTYEWLIDVDAPTISKRLDFNPQDHFGGEAPSLRTAVKAFAEHEGETVLDSDRIYMLASARTSGYVFNPLTVYWIFDAAKNLKFAILEIHNTYGDRHAHIVKPDESGRGEIEKVFYVSPFFEVRGEYKVVLRLSPERITVSVNLHQDGKQVFTAVFSGIPVEPTWLNRIRAAIRTPFATWQTMVRIRVHGIWLWLRRLPVIQRPNHPKQKGML
ncbi:MAG: hypothetical protein RL038_1099 [Actinomycetota bacterium]